MNMTNYRGLLEEAVQATVIHSATGYSWFGQRSQPLPRGARKALTKDTARSYLLFNLQNELYSSFYCRGFAAPSDAERSVGDAASAASLAARLSTANSGAGCWESGWEVRSVAGQEITVSNAELELVADERELRVADGADLAPGAPVAVLLPKEFIRISPGFYMALGDHDMAGEGASHILRIYLNLNPEGAVRFMQAATRKLNQEQFSFRLKAANSPEGYRRRDPVVLYIRQADYQPAAALLEEILSDVAGLLRFGVPAFTKPLAEGVGLAEDPGDGESFGLHRCQRLADGMIRASEQGKTSLQDRLEAVEERFSEDGISLERPYLNADSTDPYGPLDVPEQLQVRSPQAKPTTSITAGGREFLETAGQIGERLTRDAFWHGDLCSWVGAEPSDPASGIAHLYKALGPDLYGGTSGVSLFLAQLYGATGDTKARDTALGAIRHAISRLDDIPVPGRLGLYTGWIGVALAAAHAGRLLAEEDLLAAATNIVQRCTRVKRTEAGFDLLSGKAGAIVGILALQHLLDKPAALDFAATLGSEIVRTAVKADGGYSWHSGDFPTRRNLTGISHGTAGVGHALIELFCCTGDNRFLEAGRQAFGYERRWFDADEGNWPDFREDAAGTSSRRSAPAFAMAWCHGAPGIGLSRLRAFDTVRDEPSRVEAVAAVRSTRETLKRAISSEGSNFSLCHGVAGNAELLMYGHQVLQSDARASDETAMRIGEMGIRLHAPTDSWPCGTGGGETPGLMLGLAGIGYFYLRLANQDVPSILLVHSAKPEFVSTDATTVMK